ncbi:tetratricopeptide repeat protein [Sorangium sp. So ce854]|uniref:tetratricopeptide repeat protein n=1 Tax=Sorangium sp. So ce854 TaxID=3133322 RepID=UPI003F5EBB54
MNADCRSELLTRVRRGVATEPDRLAFDAHLGACASCRMTWEIAQDFDAVGAAEPGDAELLARIARVAIGRAAACGAPDNDVLSGDDAAPRGSGFIRQRAAGWRRGAWLYAAAAVLLGGAAAAATALLDRRPAPGPGARPVEPALRAVVARPRPPAPAAPPAPDVAPTGAQPAPTGAQPAQAASGGAPASGGAGLTELAAPAPRPHDTPRAPGASAPPPAASTAEQLFREANDARRAGSAQRAIELYRALQRRFAGSPEATLSLVSLGSLLLDGGSPGAALAQFDRYLGVAGARPLAVEALYGRGRALRALGRSGDEAQTWRRMLREHPSSPYAEHARRRLAELGG